MGCGCKNKKQKQETEVAPNDPKDRGVVMAFYGDEYNARISVAVSSLRKNYEGEVTVFTNTKNKKILALFKELEINTIPLLNRDPNLCKIEAMKNTPYGTNIFMDADILVRDDITPIFEYVEKFGMALANFMDFKPTDAFYRGRLDVFKEFDEMYLDSLKLPVAVWGAVIGFKKDHEFLDSLEPFVQHAVDSGSKYAFDVSCHLLVAQYKFFIMSAVFCSSSTYYNPLITPTIVHYHGNRHAIETCKWSKEWLAELDTLAHYKIAVGRDKMLKKLRG